MLILALFIRTLRPISALQILLNQIRTLALWTLFGNRLAPSHKIALGIQVTAIESLATLRPPLNDIALMARRTGHANRVLLHVFASWIIGTSDEFAKAAKLLHQLTVASGAIFFIRRLLLLP